MERTPAAAEAVLRPPACLSGFKSHPLPLEADGLDLSVDFALACKSCGGDVFEISAFPLVVPDPSPYFAVEPGEIIQRPPHSLRCVACGSKEDVFDIRTQGHDGVLGITSASASGVDGESFIAGQFRVVAAISYNIELDELSEIAEEANVNPSDLFDWFTLLGTPISGGDPIELSYECA